jgi:tRNA-2-methylthio-N6-dimethylallyladenosine synthase
MKYFIKTFGCQMNESDSERIAGFLESLGLRPILKNTKADLSAEALAKADLVIFNTCGVRQSAEDRVYGQIHNLRKNSPKTKIILTGCLANRKDVQRRLKNKVDLFIPIKDIPKLLNLKLFKNFKLKIKNSSTCNSNYLKLLPRYTSPFTAYIPIMTGCNNFCSYCVVPYARGPEISRPFSEIISEVKKLIEKGYKEIILLGQNVNSYKDKTINFSTLLRKINNIKGNFWINFVSNHPKDFSDELIETATKLKKVCELIHLPIQAGSDEILQEMNRKYTARQYLSLINKIKKSFRKNKPNELYAITSDIIVGFPEETKKQFLESAKIMKRVRYDMVYFGQYSPRPGTAAWKMKDSVSKKEKGRREKYLNEILKKTSLENNKKYLGKIMEVLITDKKGQFYFGHTRTYKNVKIKSDKKDLIGKLINVEIIKANIWNLKGKIKNEVSLSKVASSGTR